MNTPFNPEILLSFVGMFRRLPCFGLVLVLLTAACSSKSDTVVSNIPDDRYVESINIVKGSFTVDGIFNHDQKPYSVNLSEAYATVVKSVADQSKQEVLVVLLEKPLPRFALAVAHNPDAEAAADEFDEVLHNRDARGVVFRLPPGSTGSGVKIRPFFNGDDYDFGNVELSLKAFTADMVMGHIKANVPSQQFDITFTVNIRPNRWTGGTFYQQPPTKLSPGQASGQLVIDGQAVKFNHAYARLTEFDLFDETKNVVKVWLTEKPVDEKVLIDDNANNLLAMKKSGNGYVFTYNTTGPADRSQPSLWWVSQLAEDAKDSSLMASSDVFDEIPGIERDYARYNNDAIEGRLFSSFPIHENDRIYKVDLLFNAAMLPATVSNGPVTAANGGQALPADGGAPAKAYLTAIERMKSAKSFDDKMAVWLSVVPAADVEKIKRDLESLSREQRQLFIDVFAPLDGLQLAGGFIKDNRATLRFTGTGREARATEVVNMHLENGEWKIARREIREE
jgi:hypothetical protein